MDLYEYQAKEMFAQHGVPTQVGIVVETPQEARAAAEQGDGAAGLRAGAPRIRWLLGPRPL